MANLFLAPSKIHDGDRPTEPTRYAVVEGKEYIVQDTIEAVFTGTGEVNSFLSFWLVNSRTNRTVTITIRVDETTVLTETVVAKGRLSVPRIYVDTGDTWSVQLTSEEDELDVTIVPKTDVALQTLPTDDEVKADMVAIINDRYNVNFTLSDVTFEEPEDVSGQPSAQGRNTRVQATFVASSLPDKHSNIFYNRFDLATLLEGFTLFPSNVNALLPIDPTSVLDFLPALSSNPYMQFDLNHLIDDPIAYDGGTPSTTQTIRAREGSLLYAGEITFEVDIYR